MFAVGGAPALLVGFIRYGVKEREGWEHGVNQLGEAWTASRAFFALFSSEYRRRTVLNALFLLISMIGLWAGSVYVPTSVSELARHQGFPPAEGTRIASFATMLLSMGTILGCLLMPLLADRIGRRATLGFFFALMFVFIALAFGYFFYQPDSLYSFIACLFFLGLGGANFAVYTLWLPEQYRPESRPTPFPFPPSPLHSLPS